MHRITRKPKPSGISSYFGVSLNERLRLKHHIWFAITIMLSVTAVGLGYMIKRTTDSVDDIALRHEQALVREGIKHHLELMARHQTFLAVNDKTAREIEDGQMSPEFAREIAHQMWLDFDHDWTIIVGPDNKPLMLASEDTVVTSLVGDATLRANLDLVSEARNGYVATRRLVPNGFRLQYIDRGELTPIYASEVREVNGQPALVSAMIIVPETGAVPLPVDLPGVFLSIRYIEPTFLASVSETLLLNNFRYSRLQEPGAAHLPVQIDGETTIGFFEWNTSAPGRMILNAIGPITAGLMLALVIVGFLTIRKLTRVSQALEKSEQRNRFLALHDPLTGLGNRAFFGEALDIAMKQRLTHPFALLAIDLDRFKAVNDTLGHEAGDQVLQKVAKDLERIIGSHGVVTRTGGDEFLALVTDNIEEGHLHWLSDAMIEVISEPLEVTGGTARIGTSIGVARSPKNADTTALLMRLADQALYHAKENGRNNAVLVEELFRTNTTTPEQRTG